MLAGDSPKITRVGGLLPGEKGEVVLGWKQACVGVILYAPIQHKEDSEALRGFI